MVRIRAATAADLPMLHPVIERAYRGDTARAGWSHEADLLSEPRTDLGALATMIDGDKRLLLACEGEAYLGCVYIADCGGGLAHLGMLCVDPLLQTGGIGKRLMTAAEDAARVTFDARCMELTVIEGRRPLIEFYVRRGYAPSGETRPFPFLLDPPLRMCVLVKSLDPR
jgi:GNAT superfamily N-acetyltransferase